MRSPLVEPHLILLGEDVEYDPNVLLGYRPGREIDDLTLRIGPRACIRSGTVVYAGTTIGADFQTGHNVVVREQCQIGDHVSIWNHTTIDYGCHIGNNVKIHGSTMVSQYTTLEDDVFLSAGVMIANDIHPGCPYSAQCMRGPTIRRGTQVGVNVTFVPWVTVGEYCLIAAGAVVTKDIPPYSLVVGNPGRVVKQVDELTCTTGIAPEGHSFRPYGHVRERR